MIGSDSNLQGPEAVFSGGKGNGGMAITIKTDVGNADDIDVLIESAVNEYGTLCSHQQCGRNGWFCLHVIWMMKSGKGY